MAHLADNEVEVQLYQQVNRAAGNVCPDCGSTDEHVHDRGLVATTTVKRSVADRIFGNFRKGPAHG